MSYAVLLVGYMFYKMLMTSIMNWNLYDIKGHYPTKYSIDQHNDLISRKKEVIYGLTN